jgi:hypothetical protein
MLYLAPGSASLHTSIWSQESFPLRVSLTHAHIRLRIRNSQSGFLLNRKATMSRPINLTLAMLLAFSTISFAQEPAPTPLQAPPPTPSSNTGQQAPKVQEPEYIGVIFYLDPSNALSPLERQKTKMEVKTKAWGYGGMKMGNAYKGSQSPVRFKAGQDIQFIVRGRVASHGGMEPPPPETLVSLKALKVSKDERMSAVMEMKVMGFGSKAQDTSRPLVFTNYGEQSYRVSPAEPLEPGEYVMSWGAGLGGNGDFLFGIDPK